jgi:1-acyl-sn-glycerol-3-phosphate acyltransferase
MARMLVGGVRLLAFGLLTGLLYGVWCMLRLFIGDEQRLWHWRNHIMRSWACGTAAITGMGLQSEGPIPQPPFLLVANHLSYMDIVALATQLDCVFVAKAEVGRWPGIGQAARALGTILIDRTNSRDVARVGGLIGAALDAGRGVVLFPEGTSSAGAQVLPFRSALLEPAVQRGLAVTYASLHYRTAPTAPPASHMVCWWGDMEFLPHFFALCCAQGFEATLRYGAEPVCASNRKLLALKLQQAVDQHFVPVIQKGSQP